MSEAIEDGVNPIGYTAWDSFDLVIVFTGEMKKRCGFIYVNKNNDSFGTLARLQTVA